MSDDFIDFDDRTAELAGLLASRASATRTQSHGGRSRGLESE